MKKLLIVLIAILSLTICLFGCSKGKGSSSDGNNGDSTVVEEEKELFAFAEQTIVVELYESAKLTVQGAKDKTLTWRSLNPERVTVNSNGEVFAKMEGIVTISVSNGDEEATCKVSVINSGYIPVLVIDLPTEVKIINGDTYTLYPYVTYNGVKYYNAQYSFSATGSVSVSANGEITANSVGTGVVTCIANWNEVESQTLTLEIEVVVIE